MPYHTSSAYIQTSPKPTLLGIFIKHASKASAIDCLRRPEERRRKPCSKSSLRRHRQRLINDRPLIDTNIIPILTVMSKGLTQRGRHDHSLWKLNWHLIFCPPNQGQWPSRASLGTRSYFALHDESARWWQKHPCRSISGGR